MKISLRSFVVLAFTCALGHTVATAQGNQPAPAVETIEVRSPSAEAEVGKPLKFTAIAKDKSGATVNAQPTAWFAAPFDLAHAQDDGTVSFYQPGEVLVGAIVGGKPGFTKIMVKTPPISRIDIAPISHSMIAGGLVKLDATARSSNGDPRSDAVIGWTSSNPKVAVVDRVTGVVTAVAPGSATIEASSGAGKGSMSLTVVRNAITALTIDPVPNKTRTGDVVRLNARATGANGTFDNRSVNWAVTGDGARVYPDGAFVAHLPGTYIVTASVGSTETATSIAVSPRNVERSIEVVGHTFTKDNGVLVPTAEQWIFGDYAYVSTNHDKLMVFDISDPANPKLTDMVKVDARHINDVSTTADGKIGVITREGASNRKNGIVFLDMADPAHPKIISEYTLTVTGGVHSAFVDGRYVYLTDDATGSMRVIDFRDVTNPKEVGRWQVESSILTTTRTKEGETVTGRYLHDLQVKDGLAYLAYWRDGLIILDVGNGMKGGTPEKPVLVSQLRFNHHELYGNGWLAGTHSVFRYKNYVFVGDEVFPPIFDIQGKARIPVRGIFHVVDVSDINNPQKVAEYAVPEAGAHNMWVEDDKMYLGYYNGGARVLDVSGELRGDLYAQGREIANLWTGHPEGFRPNMPFTWGAQPHKGLIFFNDMNSGLWITRLGAPKFKGSTTEPGQ